MVEQFIYDMIQAKSALTDLIGTRVNPVIGSKDAPYIRYEIMSTQANEAKNSVSKMDFVYVDFFFYASTRLALASLTKTFREQIDGHSDANIGYAYFQEGGDGGYNTDTDLYEYHQEYKLEIKR